MNYMVLLRLRVIKVGEGNLAVLTIHRIVIHCRSAVRKTLCVFLTTSELFALRAHNPTTKWYEPLQKQKRKQSFGLLSLLCKGYQKDIFGGVLTGFEPYGLFTE